MRTAVKYFRLLISVVLASAALVATATSASAAVTVFGGPYSNLKASGDTIRLQLSNFPTTAGMYIQQCLNTSPARPTSSQCNATAIWVSSDPSAPVKPTDTIAIPVVSTFGTVDCMTATCALFFRLDHTAPRDTSEDRFINISFAAGSGTALPLDEVTSKVGGAVLTLNVPGTLAYRTPITLTVTTKSGATPTLKVYSDGSCTWTGFTVTALKGPGQCDIAVTSPGNTSYSTVTAHYPVNLTTGEQKIALTLPKQLVGSKLLFNSKTVTNMGEKPKATVSPSNTCSLKTTGSAKTGGVNTMLLAKKKGSCTVTITAPARDGLYNALNQTFTLSVKAK